MPAPFARSVAVTILTATGFVLAATAIGLVVAPWAISTQGIQVSPHDAALLSDLSAVAPYVGAFAVLGLVAAGGLLVEATWASVLGSVVGAVAVTFGAVGLTLLFLGNDPFAAGSSGRGLDGIEMIGVVTALYAAVLVALAVDGRGRRRPTSPSTPSTPSTARPATAAA